MSALDPFWNCLFGWRSARCTYTPHRPRCTVIHCFFSSAESWFEEKRKIRCSQTTWKTKIAAHRWWGSSSSNWNCHDNRSRSRKTTKSRSNPAVVVEWTLTKTTLGGWITWCRSWRKEYGYRSAIYVRKCWSTCASGWESSGTVHWR